MCSVLANDEIITLHVGSYPSKNYHMLASLLRSVSPGLRKKIKAFKDNHEGQPVTLNFSGDDPKVWDILFYWIVYRELPNDVMSDRIESRILLHSWLLGKRVGMFEFQDDIMLALLFYHDDPKRPISLELTTKTFADSPPDSVMRKFLGENVVLLLKGSKIKPADLKGGMDALPGATVAIVEAEETYDKLGEEMFDRFKDGTDDRWKEFMTAGGPKQHWVYKFGDGDGR